MKFHALICGISGKRGRGDVNRPEMVFFPESGGGEAQNKHIHVHFSLKLRTQSATPERITFIFITVHK